MSLASTLQTFEDQIDQCLALVATAHRQDATGAFLFTINERRAITIAAFLNTFIAWESFIEDSMSKLMSGEPTIIGAHPIKFVAPLNANAAKEMVIGTYRYFDYANHENVRKLVSMYFSNGYPFEPHIGSAHSDLNDLRTMRNASAHISSTTQKALEGLSQRIFGIPRVGVDLYTILLDIDPRRPGKQTVLSASASLLKAVASLIANG